MTTRHHDDAANFHMLNPDPREWGPHPYFTRTDIRLMMQEGYIKPGTLFEHDGERLVVEQHRIRSNVLIRVLKKVTI